MEWGAVRAVRCSTGQWGDKCKSRVGLWSEYFVFIYLLATGCGQLQWANLADLVQRHFWFCGSALVAKGEHSPVGKDCRKVWRSTAEVRVKQLFDQQGSFQDLAWMRAAVLGWWWNETSNYHWRSYKWGAYGAHVIPSVRCVPSSFLEALALFSLSAENKKETLHGKCRMDPKRTMGLCLICLILKSRSLRSTTAFICFIVFLRIFFLATSFFSFDGPVIPELYTLLILPVFKAVIKWSLLDFREMIMVPKMTESGSWWQKTPLIRRQQ